MKGGLRRPLVKIGIHPCRGSRLGELFLEHLSNIRILVIVLDLVATLFDVFVHLGDVTETLAQTIFDSAQARRQIARAGGAGVEMFGEISWPAG